MASDRLPSKLPFVRILLKPHVTWAVLVPKQAVLKLLHGQCRFPSHHPPLADHPSGFCLPHIWQPTEFTVSQVLYPGTCLNALLNLLITLNKFLLLGAFAHSIWFAFAAFTPVTSCHPFGLSSLLFYHSFGLFPNALTSLLTDMPAQAVNLASGCGCS